MISSMVKIRRADGSPVVAPSERAAAATEPRFRHELDEAVISRGYAAGASIRTLATEHGVAYGTMHRRLLAAGVELRPRGDWRHTRAQNAGK